MCSSGGGGSYVFLAFPPLSLCRSCFHANAVSFLSFSFLFPLLYCTHTLREIITQSLAADTHRRTFGEASRQTAAAVHRPKRGFFPTTNEALVNGACLPFISEAKKERKRERERTKEPRITSTRPHHRARFQRKETVLENMGRNIGPSAICFAYYI